MPARPNSRLRGLGGSLLLLAGGTLVAVLALELVLRLHDPFGQRLRGDQILLPANVRYVLTHSGNPKLDPEIVLSKNALGFRGPDPPADFDLALTLVAVGGSTTECRYLTDGKDWPAALERRLAPHFRRLWINNAGLDGHSSFGHLKLLEQRLVRLRPKLVLFLVGANDVEREDLKYQDRALTERRDTGLSAQGLLMWAARHSALVATAVNLWRGGRAERLQLTHRYVRLETLPKSRFGRLRAEAVLETHRQQYLPGYRGRILELVTRARAAGMQPILVTQPALYGPAVDDVTGVDLQFIEVNAEDGSNGGLAWRILDAYNEVVREVGSAQAAPVIDLGARLPKSSRLFYDFLHLTNAGAEATADIIATELCPFLAERFPGYCTNPCEP